MAGGRAEHGLCCGWHAGAAHQWGHRAVTALVGQGAVGVAQAQQAHLGAAQRQAQPVVVAAVVQRQAQLHQCLCKGVGRHHGQRTHSGHVQRRTQGGAHTDPALKTPVVVLRNVEPRLCGDVGGRVFNQRGGREAVLPDGLCVQKRLECGACLAQGQHMVDFRGLAEPAGRSHPGQHLAAGVVQHHHGTVFGALVPQFAQLVVQQLGGVALQRRAQGGAQGGGCCCGWVWRWLATPLLQCHTRCMGRHTVAAAPAALGQVHLRQQLQSGAIGLGVRAVVGHGAQHGAGALAHGLGAGVGCANQGRRHGRFLCVQAMGGFAKQGARQRVDAHQLATEGHQVDVGLQNLVFAPAGFEPARPHGLAGFLAPVAPAGAGFEVGIQQAGQLHGERGRASGTGVPHIAPGRRSHRVPVDAGVFVKALVFAEQQGQPKGVRHLVQRHPLALALLVLGAQALQRVPAGVLHQGFRSGVPCFDLVKPGQSVCLAYTAQHTTEHRAGQQQAAHTGGPQAALAGGGGCHGWHQGRACTTQRGLGVRPNISGAYMASMRVGGKAKSPALFRRTVYSTLLLPLGR